MNLEKRVRLRNCDNTCDESVKKIKFAIIFIACEVGSLNLCNNSEQT